MLSRSLPLDVSSILSQKLEEWPALVRGPAHEAIECGDHARQLLYLLSCSQTLEGLKGSDLIWVRLNSPSSDQVSQELARAYSKCTLGCDELQLVLSQYVERLPEVIQVSFWLLGLDNHFIYVVLHAFPKLVLEHDTY